MPDHPQGDAAPVTEGNCRDRRGHCIESMKAGLEHVRSESDQKVTALTTTVESLAVNLNQFQDGFGRDFRAFCAKTEKSVDDLVRQGTRVIEQQAELRTWKQGHDYQHAREDNMGREEARTAARKVAREELAAADTAVRQAVAAKPGITLKDIAIPVLASILSTVLIAALMGGLAYHFTAKTPPAKTGTP